MMHLRKLLIILVLPLLLLACQTIDLNRVGNILKNTTTLLGDNSKKEKEIGTGMAARLVDVAPLVDNGDLQRRVNHIGTWLSLHLDDSSDWDWKFAVIESQDINAFATPAGIVLVTRGLLEKVGDDHELAGVLAHEMAHVTGRHYVKGIRLQAGLGLAGDLAASATDNEEYRNRIDKAAAAGTELWSRGLDKKLEFECDRHAVVLAARSGYDPYGLVAVLQSLEAIDPEDSSLAMLFKSHPRPTERLEMLAKAIEGSGQLTGM